MEGSVSYSPHDSPNSLAPVPAGAAADVGDRSLILRGTCEMRTEDETRRVARSHWTALDDGDAPLIKVRRERDGVVYYCISMFLA